MDLMARRRWLLQGISEATGWKKKIFIPSSDLLKGNTVTSAIKAELPQNYMYAVALRHTVESVEGYAFICCSFLPTSSNVYGIRNKASGFDLQALSNLGSSSYDVRIRSGEQIDIYWREEAIATDTPVTSWKYKTLQPGTISNAAQLKNALTGIGTWQILISVADLDFRNVPETNNTFCTCCAYDLGTFTWSWERYRNGAYVSGSSTQSTYDLVVGSTTKLANFYLV